MSEYLPEYMTDGNDRYPLCDWEENGYDDSDGYLAVWNDTIRKVESILTWTTRGGMPNRKIPLCDWNVVVFNRARNHLQQEIFNRISAAEERDVMSPETVIIDQRVQLLESHRNMETTFERDICRKCEGSGRWTNPRRSFDVRECLCCKGKGCFKKNVVKVKDSNGRQNYVTFTPGTSGIVKDVKCFETVYRNGYNTRGRHNLQCVVLLDDGREANIPLKKLRLDREMMSADDLMERAEMLSYHLQFKPLMSHHGGWLDNNYVETWYKNHKDEV